MEPPDWWSAILLDHYAATEKGTSVVPLEVRTFLRIERRILPVPDDPKEKIAAIVEASGA